MHSTIHLNIRDQPVIIRPAELAEIIDLRHSILRAGLPRTQAIFDGDELPTSSHFGAFIDKADSPALCCATFHLSRWQGLTAYQLRGMATDPAWAGQSLGRVVLQLGINSLVENSQVHLFWCNARIIAVPFYEKLGWRIASDMFEIATAGPHYRMVLESMPS